MALYPAPGNQQQSGPNILGGQYYIPQQQPVINPETIKKLQEFMAQADSKSKENAFLKTVQDAIDKRRIFRKRIAAVTGGVIGFLTAPLMAIGVVRLWKAFGIPEYPAGIGSLVICVGLMFASVAAIVQASDKGFYEKW